MAWRLHSAFAPPSFQNPSSMPWFDDASVWLGNGCFRSALGWPSCVMCIPPVPTRATLRSTSRKLQKNLLSNRGTWRIARHQARHALGPTSRASCHQGPPSAALRPLPVLQHAIPPTSPPSQRAIDVRRPLFVSAQISPKTTAAARPSPGIGLA
ncbi:hypothetical protein BC567DRAFT_222647 [Phyllosticta citribraziliensis]